MIYFGAISLIIALYVHVIIKIYFEYNSCAIFIYLFILIFLPHHKLKWKQYKKKIERMDLTMARRPKGNYEAYIIIILMCSSLDILWDICLWSYRYFIHQIVVIVQSIWHSFSLRNYLLVLARRIKATVLWAKPFDCEELNKIDSKLFSSCFRHLCISLC